MTEQDLLDTCRVAAKWVEDACVERDAAIIAARQQGLPLRMIADAADISHTTVVNICQRANDE